MNIEIRFQVQCDLQFHNGTYDIKDAVGPDFLMSTKTRDLEGKTLTIDARKQGRKTFSPPVLKILICALESNYSAQ